MSAPVIAVFGGSFNPPHFSHLMVCLVALETGAADQVWLVPTYRHVFGKDLVSFEHRVAMCERMVSVLGPRVRVDPIEGEMAADPSHMLGTLEELQSRHRDHQFRLLVGSDILAETHRWHRWDRVCEVAPPLFVSRTGALPPEGTEICGPPLPAISSTTVRQRLKTGVGVESLVPRSVLDYIAGQSLYR